MFIILLLFFSLATSASAYFKSKIRHDNIKQINSDKSIINDEKSCQDSDIYSIKNKNYNKNIPFKKRKFFENYDLSINKKTKNNDINKIIEKKILENEIKLCNNIQNSVNNNKFNLNKELNHHRYFLMLLDFNDNILNTTINNYNFNCNLKHKENSKSIVFENLEICSKEINYNIYSLINSSTFLNIFEILQNDLINILNGYEYLKMNNNDFENLVYKIKKNISYKDKIPIFCEILKEIINIDLTNNYTMKPTKKILMNSILSTKYKERSSSAKKFNNKIQKKLFLLKSNININFELKEIFKYSLDMINKTADKILQTFYLYGLQNLFTCDLKKSLPHFCSVIICLYAYNHEKEYFDLDWHKKLFVWLSVSQRELRHPIYLERLFKQILKNDMYVFFRLYITMNSYDISFALEQYTKLKNNDNHFLLINNLIVLLNIVKSKIYGVTNY